MSTTAIFVAVAVVVAVGLIYALLNRAGQGAVPDVMVLSQLRQAGSDLSKPHPIEFFLYFPAETGARRIAQDLDQQGFSSVVAPSDNGGEWLLKATKTMVPRTSELVRLRESLNSLSATEQGRYDGWGTPVVK